MRPSLAPGGWGELARSTVHMIEELVARSDSIWRRVTWVTKHYQGVLIEFASQADGMAFLTVLHPIRKRKHLYPQYLSGASRSSSQTSFFLTAHISLP